MTTILELRQDRAQRISEARQILDGAENGVLSAEDQRRYDALFNEAQQIGETIQRRESQERAERDLEQPIERGIRPEPDGEREISVQFESRGLRSLNDADPQWVSDQNWRTVLQRATPEYRAAYGAWLRRGREIGSGERRALQADSDTLGGYLTAPMQMVDQLIKFMDNMVWIRQWATIFPVPNAQSLGAPSLDNDPDDADWTTELATGSEDSTMSFGRRELNPHPLAKRIKVSRKLLRMVPNVEALINQRLGYKFGVTQEKAYLTGSGAGQPLGVFTASSNGISTGRDVSTGNTTTAIGADNLREVKYSLKQQYRMSAQWMFHRDGIKQVSKLKDGQGQYLWQPGLAAGDPDMLLNMPVAESEYAPNTFTSGLYVGILGDFSHYWIADALNFELQRLTELYAETNQVGIIGRYEGDGMPVLEEAFARVKLA